MTLHHIEIVRGRSAEAPPIVKHVIRFCRRLHEHGIHFMDRPAAVESDRSCTILVGKRHERAILIHPEGDLRQACKPVWSTMKGWHSDPQAWTAHNNRYHAEWLRLAGNCRRRGWKKAALADLAVAAHARGMR